MTPAAKTRTPSPGTRPEGTRDALEAAARVREMFSRIAPRYDLLNRLLSLGIDVRWRRRAARRFRHILGRSDARVLDLCCGTGDLALALWKEGSREASRQGRTQGARVWGSDFSHPMLLLARQKSPAAGGRRPPVDYFEADALRLPFPDSSFDLLTFAFGFRNLVDYEAGLREIVRVLKPGGEVGILEFAQPDDSFFGALYRLYFTRILPRIGGAISGSADAYSYLPASVGRFPSPEELRAMMNRSGLSEARFESWTGGIVALHTAQKP